MNYLERRYLSRRRFLASGGRGMSAFFLGPLAGNALATRPGVRQLPMDQLNLLQPLLPPDENGLRLPPGFHSRIVARSGRKVVGSSRYRWHEAPDGGACYGTGDGGWIYVSNSEVKEDRGGVGAIRFSARGDILEAYPILSGTNNNCAGGKTPWNTWLSCEEIERGLVYECDPFGHAPAQPRPALGRFKHEAVAVDPRQGMLYLTEDEPDGALYRFRPRHGLPDLTDGELEVAELLERDGERLLRWHPVSDPAATDTPTRHQLDVAAAFNGGEGIVWSSGLVYFTTKGDNRVWAYDTVGGGIGVLYDKDTSPSPHLGGVDNVTITAAGDVLVAEDGDDMQLVLLSVAGDVIPVLQVVGQDQSEICGPAFDPTFRRLYFSSQTGALNRPDDGMVFEVSYNP